MFHARATGGEIMKRAVVIGCAVVFFVLVCAASGPAKMGSGKVSAKSGDVNWELFGSLKVYPHLVDNVDFNDNDTEYDYFLDESGAQGNEESIRNEARIGFNAQGQNWTFLSILEADFVYNKANADRGAGEGLGLEDSGMTGEDFGIEKLEATYDFGAHGMPVKLGTGWNTKGTDMATGGMVYGDDHPFIELSGELLPDVKWDFLYLVIQDDLDQDGETEAYDADDMDWRAYSLKLEFPLEDTGFHVSPFYLYSDNEDREADVHYFGLEGIGEFGIFTPRAELVYITGEKDNHELANGNTDDVDIESYALFAALEADLHPLFKPFVGGYFYQGDGDANDGDIDAYNAVTNIARYSPVFGMENAFIYRYIPAIGSHLYDGTPSMLGGSETGYGGISNTASANSPGMVSMGLGAKGSRDNWEYKAMLQYFQFEDTGALEDVEDKSIDDEMGLEFDLNLTYNFTNHFSLGNTLSIFEPGDGIQDLRGDDFDQTAIMNTFEMRWSF
jgi:hypothetical protein